MLSLHPVTCWLYTGKYCPSSQVWWLCAPFPSQQRKSAFCQALKAAGWMELPDGKFMPWSDDILRLASKQQFVRMSIHLTKPPVCDLAKKGE